jgi:HAMP domain-containing protein
MQKLVSTNEAASILGLSVQGIHYRIKTNKLESVKKNGKTYVYIEDTNQNTEQQNNTKTTKITPNDFDYAIKLKDEQISILKKSIKWMRTQHKSEIKRLEKNQNKIIDVFKSEVNLLQKAYNEMQNLYKSSLTRIEHKEDLAKMSVEQFFILMKKNKKSNIEIKNLIFQQIKMGDKRFSFDTNTKELIIYKDNFLDLM